MCLKPEHLFASFTFFISCTGTADGLSTACELGLIKILLVLIVNCVEQSYCRVLRFDTGGAVRQK